MSEKDKSDLKVIEGEGLNPADFDDTPEELEALAVRLADALMTLRSIYNPFDHFDSSITLLYNGMGVILEAAEEESDDLADIANQSLKGFFRQAGWPKHGTQPTREMMAESLEAIGTAVFESQTDDLIQNFPSEVWTDKRHGRAADALKNGLGYTSYILRTLKPMQEGEEPKDYKKRLETYITQACQKIRAGN